MKNTKVLLGTILGVSWVGFLAGGGTYYYLEMKEDETQASDQAYLQEKLDAVGELVTAYAVVSDVPMGKEINEEDLIPVEVPVNLSTNMVLDVNELLGKHYRMDITGGTTLNIDSIYDEELTDDLRLYDVVLDSIPIGLEEGAYIDVRIALPKGEDYIGVAHRKVYGIYGNTVKLGVNEHDIHSYNSMLIDSVLYSGTQIYASEYIEGGIQAGADNFYPISTSVVGVAQRDPNLLTAIKSDIVERRQLMETGLEGSNIELEDPDSLNGQLDRGREMLRSRLTEANREYEVQRERQLEAERQATQGY